MTRYAAALERVASPEALAACSRREGAAVIGEFDVDGVAVSFLDLSTYGSTGTFKDWVACVTIAHCVENGIRRFVTQSSGNTSNAIAYYASENEVEALIFYPEVARYKINSRFASAPGIEMIEVRGPEPWQKALTSEAALRLKLPWFPGIDWQREANKLRAYFVNDCIDQLDCRFDWHAQALSSAYGPLGYYSGIRELRSADVLRGRSTTLSWCAAGGSATILRLPIRRGTSGAG